VSAEGRITFFFADLEGSTALQQNAELDYPALIGTVRRLLREATTDHEGSETDAVGDEYVAVFADPARAAEAAFVTQRAFRDAEWPGGVAARVRIGLHTGAPSFGDEGYTGIDVVRASRIANAGHGGQIVASDETVAELSGVPLRELGEYRLEGLSVPQRIYQLMADDLPRDFPPLRNTISTLGAGIRVVLADDTVLLREGVARLLADAGFDVCAQSGDAEDLLRHVAFGRHRHVVVVAVKVHEQPVFEGGRRPDGDGVIVTKAILRRPPPVLLQHRHRHPIAENQAE
jgi:class 3 adenylate cyclase